MSELKKFVLTKKITKEGEEIPLNIAWIVHAPTEAQAVSRGIENGFVLPGASMDERLSNFNSERSKGNIAIHELVMEIK